MQGSQKMNQINLDEYRKVLEEFLEDYKTYIASYYDYGDDYRRADLRTKMQRQTNLVSRIIANVHKGITLKIEKSGATLSFYQALSSVLTNSFSKSEEIRNFVESNV